ncbi:MAG: hypothetical protein HY368_00850 [Candidatus Aenigmarchaeota archaeon]|nr:hypothetical protein [Candidatus Aenigmarchaeota archaeon]
MALATVESRVGQRVHAVVRKKPKALLVGLQNEELPLELRDRELITVRAILRNHGYDSWEARSCSAALNEIQQQMFDLYISDISFPMTDRETYRNELAPFQLNRILEVAYRGGRFNYTVISDQRAEPELPGTVKVIWREQLTEDLPKYLDELNGR